jgi:hypothetical protein
MLNLTTIFKQLTAKDQIALLPAIDAQLDTTLTELAAMPVGDPNAKEKIAAGFRIVEQLRTIGIFEVHLRSIHAALHHHSVRLLDEGRPPSYEPTTPTLRRDPRLRGRWK